MLKIYFLLPFSGVISFNEKLHAVHFSIVDAGVDDDLHAGKLVNNCVVQTYKKAKKLEQDYI